MSFVKLLSLVPVLIFFFVSFSPPISLAQEQPVQSQLLTSSITVSDTTKFTISGTVTLKNNSSKGYDNAQLIIELLQPGKPVEETGGGGKISRVTQPLVISYQKAASITIKPGQILEQQFTLKYPATVETGDYLLTAELFDADSSSQSIASHKLALNGNGGFLTVDPASCNIAVGQTNYQPFEGPTINPKEQGVASCIVKNPNSTKVEARMIVPYAPFSVSRNPEDLESLTLANDLITLEPNQEKRILFNLPNNLSPTVYEGYLQLLDLSGQVVSANIQFRWIIPGESAKIQNLDSDRTYYKKDEVAKISASILGSADMGWRGQGEHPFSPNAGTDLNGAKALVKITDDQGNTCGETTSDLPSTEQKAWDNFYFDININQDCNNPTATAQILSSNDQVLDQVIKPTTSTDTDIKAAGKMTPEEKARTTIWVIIGSIILLVIIASVAFWMWKKKKGMGGPPPKPSQSVTTAQQISVPSATTVGIILVILAIAAITITKFELNREYENFSPVKESHAQAATVKAPNNSTDAGVDNVFLGPGGNARPKNGGYRVHSNARDFVQKGGDSRVVVAPNCDKIDLEIHASAGSANTCGNWGTGAPVAVYYDGQPITVNNDLNSPVRNEIYRPVPGLGDNSFDMLQMGGYSGQRHASFSVTPASGQKGPGEHTLTVRVGASYMVRHTGVEEHSSTFENNFNCGTNAPCYVELTHKFVCVQPKQCDEECANDLECGGEAGCNTCRDNGEGKKTCQPPPACNATCSTSEDCAANLSDCKTCRPDPTGQKTCQPAPPQCNAACSADRDCFGGLNGCNACVEGSCQKPPACGSTCTTDATCERSLDTCTQCVSGTCRVPPACGTACTTRADCAGARDGCAECMEGTCTNFNENMCKCDGFDAVSMKYPSNDPFVFDAFAKIEGTDIAKARVESIAFKMSESDAANPNEGTIIAESQPMTPQIVSTDASKVRFKATWSLQPPEVKKGKIYRVFSEIKCKPKKIVNPPIAAAIPANEPDLYQSKVAGISTANAQENAGVEVAGDDLQLTTLNFVKLKERDMCRFLTYEYNEGIE